MLIAIVVRCLRCSVCAGHLAIVYSVWGCGY